MLPDPPASSQEEAEIDINALRPHAQIAQLAKIVITASGQRMTLYELQAQVLETESANKHRRAQEIIDNEQRRKREQDIFRAMMIVGGLILVVCIVIIFSGAIPGLDTVFDPNARQTALTALFSLLTLIIGYATGQLVQKKPQ
jgi:predicted nucleic acid-binding Zn ribbon protein